MPRDTHENRNLAARMGRWSAAHWKTATFGWLALVVVAFAVGGQVGTKQIDPNAKGPGESGRMDKILDAGFKQPAGESVLIQNRSLQTGTPAFAAAVDDVVARLSKVAVVRNVQAPKIAGDRHAVLIDFDISGDKDTAADRLDPVLTSVSDAGKAHPSFFVGEFGGASAAKGVDSAFADDLKSAGVYSIPLTLIILVAAFGALVAAGIPLLLALTAVFATFGLVALPSHVIPLAQEAFAVVLLIGLAVRVDRLHVPLVRRRRRSSREGGAWGGIVDAVLRRPLLSASLAGGLLIALAIPALQMHMATPGPDTFPHKLAVVKTYNRMQQEFPGNALPANVVIKSSNVNAPTVRNAIAALERRALATGQIEKPITVDTNRSGTVANITMPIKGTGTDAASMNALALLRDELIPATVGAVPAAEVGVTGIAARWSDELSQQRSKLPYVVAFVLIFAFCLMLIAFRSIVVALKAIVLNLLSVGAAFGILVLVFQHGVGKGMLGFSSTAGISPVVPMLLFVILFGLSMDYHVFIISRIRETFDRGASMDDAISYGIKSTAGTVTSAAIVMVAVFSIFATLSMLMFKQFGVGLAAAILIDATIVRGVLLPATMKLLGERNWYLPRWLEWLPRLEGRESEPPVDAKPVLSA